VKIVYLVKARTLEKHKVIKLFLDVFKPRYISTEVLQDSFLPNTMYIAIILNADGSKATLYLKSNLSFTPDLELKIYQDIQTIPLMNNALIEFKRSQLSDH